MSLKMKFLNKAAIGFCLSVLFWIVLVIISLLQSNQDVLVTFDSSLKRSLGSRSWAIIVEILLAGLIGVVGMGGSVVYEIEKWSILKATTVHFLSVMTTFILISNILEWFSSKVELLIWCICMVIAYIGIWFIQYSIFKKEINQINKDLERIKKLDERMG